MAKIDKTGLSKQEARRLIEERRRLKTQKISDNIDPNTENFVLCLKHGQKYSADYVNKLYRGVKQNCTVPFQFACLTEDPEGLDKDIITIPLPTNLAGWWCKPYMFSKDLPIKGTILYMDLDVVIAGNIDKLITFQPNHWCTVRDFTRAMRPGWHKYNSSVVKFKTGELDHVWQEYAKDPQAIQRRYFGDQDYLFDATKQHKPMLYPDSWVLSWKWEVRKSREMKPGGIKGKRLLKHIEDVTPRIECAVCVFHGDPNPHNCEDPWVIKIGTTYKRFFLVVQTLDF